VSYGTSQQVIYLAWWLIVCGSCNKQRATRAVHNRATACVAAGGGIFENQP